MTPGWAWAVRETIQRLQHVFINMFALVFSWLKELSAKKFILDHDDSNVYSFSTPTPFHFLPEIVEGNKISGCWIIKKEENTNIK